jgi:hypothetical protein
MRNADDATQMESLEGRQRYADARRSSLSANVIAPALEGRRAIGFGIHLWVLGDIRGMAVTVGAAFGLLVAASTNRGRVTAAGSPEGPKGH